MSKLRVLCLHGYRQDGLKLRGRIAALRRAFKTSVEFVCLDAPFAVPYEPTSLDHANSDSGKAGEKVKQLTWFDFSRDDDDRGHERLERVDESIAYVANYVKEEGPFDGIFGFSQGGTLASLILQRQMSTSATPFAFRFAFFVSAGACSDPTYASNVQVDLPSLHVIGESDAVVNNERSLALKGLFTHAKLLLHPGGHYIPTNKGPKDAFRAFFNDLRDARETKQ